jgi:hypothetical protein
MRRCFAHNPFLFVCFTSLLSQTWHNEQAGSSHEKLLDKFFGNPHAYFGNLGTPSDEVVEAGVSPASPRPVLKPRLWNQVQSNLSQVSAAPPAPPPGAGAAPAAPGYKTWTGSVGCESVQPDEPLCLPDTWEQSEAALV